MGLKGFRSWFESQFPTAITEVPKLKKKQKTKKGGDGDNTTNKNRKNGKTKKKTDDDEDDDNGGNVHSFDHVLVDMNPILHVLVRQARTDEYAMILLFQELDRLMRQFPPRKSLVLALDGPAAAAKLATQRKRRYGLAAKNAARIQQLTQLSKQTSSAAGAGSAAVSGKQRQQRRRRKNKLKGLGPKALARRVRKLQMEDRTQCVTTGTEFMGIVCRAVQYWAWQRLASRNARLADGATVRVYLSPSTVAGEGEVKLLEWLYAAPRRGETVCLIGGDSDLVLEALTIPVASTHNVFVLLDDNRRYLSVNIWECTRSMAALVSSWPPTNTSAAAASSVVQQPVDRVMQLRTDLVFLLILHGNDYLPRLRGSSGIARLFRTYLRVSKQLRREEEQQRGRGGGDEYDDYDDGNTSKAAPPARPVVVGFVHPDTLHFRPAFCRAFFERLAATAPPRLRNDDGVDSITPIDNEQDSTTALSQLYNLMSWGYVPQPMKFKVLRRHSTHKNNDRSNDGNDDVSTNDERDVDQVHFDTGDRIVDGQQQQQLEDALEDSEDDVEEEDNTLEVVDSEDDDDDEDDDGEEGMDNDNDKEENKFLVQLTLGQPGSDDFYSYQHWHRLEQQQSKPPRTVPKNAKQALARMALDDLLGLDDEVDEDYDDDEEEDVIAGLATGIATARYDWEVGNAFVPPHTEAYLYGILWNVQTYQDGISPDYSYNYGRRQAPTVFQMADYFENLLQQEEANGTKIGPLELAATLRRNSTTTATTTGATTTLRSPVDYFTPAMVPGVACLAALPFQYAKDLVPPPYRAIVDAADVHYGAAMDPDTNVFDMEKFSTLCNQEIEQRQQQQQLQAANVVNPGGGGSGGNSGRNEPIVRGEDSWILISKDSNKNNNHYKRTWSTPPPPVADRLRLRPLQPSPFIRIQRIKARMTPVERPVWTTSSGGSSAAEQQQPRMMHSDPGPWMLKFDSLDRVPFKTAFANRETKKNQRKRQVEMAQKQQRTPGVAAVPPQPKPPPKKGKKKQQPGATIEQQPSPPEATLMMVKPPETADGVSASACLKQLEDAGVIASVACTVLSTPPPPGPTDDDTNDAPGGVAEDDEERIRLCVSTTNKENKTYEQRRPLFAKKSQDSPAVVSRAAVKHYLASLALRDLVETANSSSGGGGGRPAEAQEWTQFTFASLKMFLLLSNEVTISITAD